MFNEFHLNYDKIGMVEFLLAETGKYLRKLSMSKRNLANILQESLKDYKLTHIRMSIMWFVCNAGEKNSRSGSFTLLV